MSVLDASVILKWFINEEDSDQALRLREEFYSGKRDIVVPDLLLYEVVNALKYNPTFKETEIKKAVKTLFDLGIKIITPALKKLKDCG
ncbi:MAG: type II toxin-antitoxin system VapC family toxin [Bacillota bacterium]